MGWWDAATKKAGKRKRIYTRAAEGETTTTRRKRYIERKKAA